MTTSKKDYGARWGANPTPLFTKATPSTLDAPPHFPPSSILSILNPHGELAPFKFKKRQQLPAQHARKTPSYQLWIILHQVNGYSVPVFSIVGYYELVYSFLKEIRSYQTCSQTVESVGTSMIESTNRHQPSVSIALYTQHVSPYSAIKEHVPRCRSSVTLLAFPLGG